MSINGMQYTIDDNVFINKMGQTNRDRLLAAGNIIDARTTSKNSAAEAYQAQSAHGVRFINSKSGGYEK